MPIRICLPESAKRWFCHNCCLISLHFDPGETVEHLRTSFGTLSVLQSIAAHSTMRCCFHLSLYTDLAAVRPHPISRLSKMNGIWNRYWRIQNSIYFDPWSSFPLKYHNYLYKFHSGAVRMRNPDLRCEVCGYYTVIFLKSRYNLPSAILPPCGAKAAK